MANHDILRILIDESSSCHIKYEERLTKLGLRKYNLNIIYMNKLAMIQQFHNPSLGFIDLLVVFGEETKVRTMSI